MATARLRPHKAFALVLVVVLAVRLGWFAPAPPLPVGQSRQLLELSHGQRHGASGSGSEHAECREVVRQDGACDGPIAEACGHGSSYVDYVHLHYCTMADMQWLSIIIQILIVVFLFVCLGVAAESFFCPALDVLSDALKLSENVAGVTFLALGNGAPDMFSSFAAVANGSFELAFGEVLGAGVFITTVCIGGVALVAPFQVTRRPFLRDVIFFLGSLVFVLLVLRDGKVVLWEAFFLVIYYVLYVVVVVVSRWINRYLKRRNPARYSNPSLAPCSVLSCCFAGTSVGSEVSPLLEKDRTKSIDTPITPTIVVTTDNDDDEGGAHSPGRGGVRIKSVTSAIDFLSVANDLTSIHQRERSSSQRSTASSISQIAATVRSQVYAHRDGDDNNNDRGSEPTFAHALTEPESASMWTQLVSLLFPTLCDFAEKSVLGKFSAIVNMPVMLALTLSVPLVIPLPLSHKGDHDDSASAKSATARSDAPAPALSIQTPDERVTDDDEAGPQWSRLLFAIQCFVAPVFVTFAVGVYGMLIAPSFPAWALSLIIGTVLAALAWFTSEHEHPPRYAQALSFVTFVVSVVWIYLFANELIAVIQTLGIIFNISETLLGLTVLAWGNSVGDFVANLTVARMGYANMAVAASFGGPMLNMLLGVGISCGYWILLNDAPFPVELNLHLLVLLASLFVILIFCLVYVPLKNFGGDRTLGVILLTFFVISTAINITVEFI